MQSPGKYFLDKVNCGFALSLLLFCLSGCNPPDSGEVLRTVPADGVATYEGKPLEHYQIVLMRHGERPVAGITDTEGKFTLGTNDIGDGAPPGEYKVAIIYVGPPSDNPDEGVMEFTQPPPPKFKIDPKYQDSEKSGVTLTVPDKGSKELKIEL